MDRLGTARWFVVGFSLYQGMRWLFNDATSAFASSQSSAAYGVILAGAGFHLFSRSLPLHGDATHRKARLRCASAIACWVSAPALLDTMLGYRPGQSDRTLSMALVPVTAAFLAHLQDQNMDGDLFSRLWPALAGLLGLLLLLPEPTPGSAKGWAGLILAPLISGGSAVWIADPPSNEVSSPIDARNGSWCVSVGLLAGGLLLMLGYWPRQLHLQDLKAGAMLLEAISIGLSLLLLLRLGAARWSAIFLLGPLFAMLCSIGLMRPHLDARSILGMLFLATGGLYSLFRADSPTAALPYIQRRAL